MSLNLNISSVFLICMDLSLINKHWKEGFVYPFPEKRELYQPLTEALGKKLIVSLVGLRRTGKTTLLKQLINTLLQQNVPRQNILFYSFDEPAELQAVIDEYLKNSSKNLDEGQLYFFLDEVQKLSDWQNKVKMYYDHYPTIKFIVSGSSSIFIRKNSESLAGRIKEFWLPPLSFREFLQFRGKKELLVKPDLFALELGRQVEQFALRQFIDVLEEPEEYVRDYLDTLAKKVVFEDIPQVYPVEQPQVLLKIFKIISANPGLLLDYHNLSSDLGIDQRTISNYIFYLEQAFLLKKLYNYSPNQLTSEKKLKKVYSLASSFSVADLSKIMEAVAVTQSKCQFFWRRTHEVDMIILEQGIVLPVEVKYTNTIREKDLSGLYAFMDKFQVDKGIVLTKQVEKKEKGISFIPLWKWLLDEKRGQG